MINFNPIFDEVENLDKDKIMEIFKTLISINTTTPPGNTYRSYVDAISPFFKNMDYNLEEVIIPDELIKISTGSNTHAINETIRLKDIKKFIKEIIVFLCVEL